MNGQKNVCELHVQVTVSAARVTVEQGTVIPAESQFVVTGEASRPIAYFQSRYGVIQLPNNQDEPIFLIGDTFVDLWIEGGILVRILIRSAEDIHLRKGTAIGYLREVDDFVELCSDESSWTMVVSQMRPTTKYMQLTRASMGTVPEIQSKS